MKYFVAVLFLLHSVIVYGSATDDFKAAFDASKANNIQSARQYFESGFKKIDSGEVVTDNALLNARVGLATVYLTSGDFNKAKVIITPIINTLKKNGPQDLYAASIQLLFYTHVFLQEDKQALEILSTLLPLQKTLPQYFPADAQANTYSIQATIQDRNGDTVGAIISQQQAIQIYKQTLPNGLGNLIAAYTTLIDYSEKINDNKTALAALKEKLALMESDTKTYAQEIFNTKIRIDAVSKRLSQQGPDVDNPYGAGLVELLARQSNIDVITVQKNLLNTLQTFGENSPVSASAMLGYASTLASIGETDYAIQVYNLLEHKIRKLYGEKSPNLAELYLNRASTRKMSAFSDLDISTTMRTAMNNDYNRAIELYNQLYGDAHPLTISALYALYESVRVQNQFMETYKLATRLFAAYSTYEKTSFAYLTRKQKLGFREQYKNIAQHFIEAAWLSPANSPNESMFGEPYPEIDFSVPDWQAVHNKKVAEYEARKSKKKAQKQALLKTAFEQWINYKGSINAINNTLTITRQKTNDASLIKDIDNYLSLRQELVLLNDKQGDWQMLLSQRKQLQQRIDTALKQLYQRIPILQQDGNISIRDVQEKIPDNAIYLEFVKLYTYQYAVFSLDAKGEVRLIRLGDDAVTTEQQVKKIRSLINDTIDGVISSQRSERLLKKELAELYDRTVGQLSGVIAGFDELIVSAEGLLALMPMGLLYDKQSQHYLVENYSIRSVPSARDLLRHKSVSKNTGITSIIADPDFNLGNTSNRSLCTEQTTSRSLTMSVLRNFDKPCIGRLPATANEAHAIKSIFKERTRVYLQANATEQALQNIKHPARLHIATHGFFLPDPSITNPLEKSGLILSGANIGIKNKTGKGVVTGLQIASMKLSGTQLVVLSACETGIGDIEQGEGVAGLNQAFLRAGAQAVIMSFWRVPDKDTAQLMALFYKNIQHGLTPAQALQAAQQSFIKQNKHPLAWAAFAYSG